MRAAVGTAAILWLAAGACPDPAASAAERPLDLARHVNPLNGTEPGATDFGTGGGAGNTFPGATLPFGMVQWSPETRPGVKAFGGGYTYSDSEIGGFGLKHMSGPGCAAYGDLPFTPTTQPLLTSPSKPGSIELADAFNAGFDHAHEVAEPGHYRVLLNPGTERAIDADLTATARTGFGRFTYPASASASMLINTGGSVMGTREAGLEIHPERREVSGSATSGQFCYQGNEYTLHFVARFSRPFAAHGTWRRELLSPGSTSSSDSIAGPPFVYQPIPGAPGDLKNSGLTARAGGYVTFDATADRLVEVRVGLSFVSVENARENLSAESEAIDFAAIRDGARDRWNRILRRVQVAGGSTQDKRMLYTSLYHSLLHPSTFSDANGEYRGMDGRVHTARGWTKYADFSGWDTYRSQMPLVAMLAPREASDMIRSLVSDAAHSGFLPKWSQANDHTHVMTGDPADPIIAGVHAFGARRFDRRAALEAMVKGATEYGRASNQDYWQRQGLPDYLRLGYVPHERNTDAIGQTFQPEAVWGSAATTLEYAVADFALARLAGSRCEIATHREFMRRSGNWRNVFNPATVHVEPRFADGRFRENHRPTDEEGFVEGNGAQYTLMVPHDPAGLFTALGGRAAATRRLDEFFADINAGPRAPHAFLGNEPTMGTPWLYDWLGQPHKTQAIVRRALLELYDPSPTGFPGNDDLGSMSSWWVFGALGMYPAVPGTDLLALGSPLFRKTVVRLPGGDLVIRAPRAARGRPYVRSLRVDGRSHRRPWVWFGRISDGATMTFELSSRPQPSWGSRPADAPPSFGPDRRLSCRPSR